MALTSIALNTGATLQGRALARNGAVTMDHNTIDSSACAAPSPTPTASPKSSQTPTPGPKSGTLAAVATPPATDTVDSTSGATADPVSEAFLIILVAGIAFVGSLGVAAIRSRLRV
jgi:type VI secretion system secreted protein VgrG